MNVILERRAPGPPPRPGLEWREETSRWIRSDTGEEHEPTTAADYKAGDRVSWTTKGGQVMTGEVMGVQPRSGKVAVKFPSGKTWPIDPQLIMHVDGQSDKPGQLEGLHQLGDKVRWSDSMGIDWTGTVAGQDGQSKRYRVEIDGGKGHQYVTSQQLSSITGEREGAAISKPEPIIDSPAGEVIATQPQQLQPRADVGLSRSSRLGYRQIRVTSQDFARSKLPTKSNATGKDLVSEYNWEGWDVPALIMGVQVDRKQVVDIMRQARKSIVQYRPQWQRELAEDLQSRPLAVHDEVAWTRMKSTVYDEKIAPDVVGFCSEQRGVHLPHNAMARDVTHELAHQLDYRTNVGRRAVSLFDQAREKNKAVSKYALTDAREYFAVSVEYFMHNPKVLQKRDPDMFQFMTRIMQ